MPWNLRLFLFQTGLRLLVPEAVREKFRGRIFKPAALETDWPPLWPGELRCEPLRGTRIREAALLHVPSRTFVLTDAAFHMAASDFGPSRIFRTFFVSDREKFSESLRKVSAWDFDRVIVNHGRILESGGKAAFREAFAEYLA